MGEADVAVRRVFAPDDAALPELSTMLQTTFADPDTVLELGRIQAFLAERPAHRQFCVLVAEAERAVLGGSIFSYVPKPNCGFSEYLLVRKNRHGHGIGRRLVESRRTLLDELSRDHGHVACHGLFIEADNPERTPSDLQARERETAMDARVRLQLFAHLGFRRVAIDYVQPPLGPGKQPVGHLDLLFAAWESCSRTQVPGDWVAETLCEIWRSWSPSTGPQLCAGLRERVGESQVDLASLVA